MLKPRSGQFSPLYIKVICMSIY